jgi:hypothetical protein
MILTSTPRYYLSLTGDFGFLGAPIAAAGHRDAPTTVLEVRKTPSWPRSWANFSLSLLYSHRNAWANLYILGQPKTFSRSLEAMTGFATAYRNLTAVPAAGRPAVGDYLADYGLAASLLECVPTYQHKVLARGESAIKC